MLIACVLLAGCQHQDGIGESGSYLFQSIDGKALILDTSRGAITVDGIKIDLADCSNEEFVCWTSKTVKLVLPKKCDNFPSPLNLIPDRTNVKVFGVDAHSDAVTWIDQRNKRFAYSYSKSQGLISITHLRAGNEIMERSYPLDRIFYTANKNPVLPCIQP